MATSGSAQQVGGGHTQGRAVHSYSLDSVDALNEFVADIPAVELVGEAVEATPPEVSETNGTDLRQLCRAGRINEYGIDYKSLLGYAADVLLRGIFPANKRKLSANSCTNTIVSMMIHIHGPREPTYLHPGNSPLVQCIPCLRRAQRYESCFRRRHPYADRSR